MLFLVVISSLIAVAATISLVSARRERQTAERTIRATRKALNATEPGLDVVDAAKALRAAADAAEARADTLEAALEGATVGVAILTGAGSVVHANPAARQLFDGEGERAVLRTSVSALAKRVGGTGNPEAIEVNVHDPDRRVLNLLALPLEGDRGGSAAVCLYVEDLSDQRRVDAMRSDFVTNASHELKTPLGALSLLAETLADAGDDEIRARLARRLRIEASRMANVVDDILKLAETEALGAEYSDVTVGELVAEAVAGLASDAKDKEIDLRDQGIEDAVVSVDRDQVVSAIRNLLNNAITYTAAKGEPGVVSYRTRTEDGMAIIEVEDSGIGIPARYTDRVFERFFRVDRARSRDSGGTGLGLSIVKNVARAHGGSVAVASKVGVGSTFALSLPTVPAGAEGGRE